MTEAKAKSLAEAVGGHVVQTMPQSRMHGVSLTRADGKFALIEEDAGAVYFDEHACWIGYHTLGDDARGVVDAEEWIDWGITELWASGLATLIGGTPYQSGGNVWVVLFERQDGRLAVIGDTGAEIYQSRDHYERYYEADQPEPERVEWE
ncbi:hypothetical protein P12x_005323 [Tundrisphaera lichenicola]|uniref:hypothetical protein n=1 Tax=Tundrisphaera lichenicola TaxID=2029860 RepID=UPI003EBA9B33